MEGGQGSGGGAAEPEAPLYGGDGALEVGAVEQLGELQQAVAQHEQLGAEVKVRVRHTYRCPRRSAPPLLRSHGSVGPTALIRSGIPCICRLSREFYAEAETVAACDFTTTHQ